MLKYSFQYEFTRVLSQLPLCAKNWNKSADSQDDIKSHLKTKETWGKSNPYFLVLADVLLTGGLHREKKEMMDLAPWEAGFLPFQTSVGMLTKTFVKEVQATWDLLTDPNLRLDGNGTGVSPLQGTKIVIQNLQTSVTQVGQIFYLQINPSTKKFLQI